MITREQLKIGEWYFDSSYSQECDWFKIITLGSEDIIVQNKDGSHNVYLYESFMKHINLAPKPKKQIKLVGYMTLDNNGKHCEFREYAEDYKWLNNMMTVKVSERTIEIED